MLMDIKRQNHKLTRPVLVIAKEQGHKQCKQEQSYQSLGFSYTQSLEIEDGSDQILRPLALDVSAGVFNPLYSGNP